MTFRNIVAASGFIAMAAISVFILAKRQFVPAPLNATATGFIRSIRESNFEAALRVTHSGFASSAKDLEKKVHDQIGDPTRIEDYEINFVHPKQTYGNRFRRWIEKRDLDLDQESVDFTLIGHGGSLVGLFEVRLRRIDAGAWRVVYLQSHAG